MRVKNGGSFWVGQVPQTSHPKKHVSDASVPCCHGILQQAPPQVCSWLVVEGVLHEICTRYLDTRTCSWTTLYAFFFVFFGCIFQTNTRGLFAATCCCLLLLYFTISFLLAFISPPKCMRQRRMVVVLYQGSGAACSIHKIKVMVVLLLIINVPIHTSFSNRVGTILTVHSPPYVNKQRTPTTTPVVRICSCVTLFYT